MDPQTYATEPWPTCAAAYTDGEDPDLTSKVSAAGQVMMVAGMLGSSVAFAKDNPLTHMPDQPHAAAISGCEAFGPGFRRLDGLDSCIKIGGHIRVESSYVSGGAGFLPASSWTK